MSCFLSSSCFKNKSLEYVFDLCGSLEIKHIELSAPHPYQSLDQIEQVLLQYKKNGFHIVLHNYFPPQKEDFVLNIATNDQNVKELSSLLIKDSLYLSQCVDASLFAVHAGYLADAYAKEDGSFAFSQERNSYSDALENMADFVNKIVKDNDSQVVFALENLFPLPDENISLNCSLEQIQDIMSLIPKEVGVLLDLGHLNISSHLMGFDRYKFLDKYLSSYGDRLCEVHLSENNGKYDQHLPLKKESWQYEVLRDISTIPVNSSFKRVYCLEARNSQGIDVLRDNLASINHNIGKSNVISY